MKSFGKYISKHILKFTAFIVILLSVNLIIFVAMFYRVVKKDYGNTAPLSMLTLTEQASSVDSLSVEMSETLRENNIWAFYLKPDGNCYWTLDLPNTVPTHYTIQDIALFAKGYLCGYPVFIRNTSDGLIVLGYPQDSYLKFTGNYFSLTAIKRAPLYLLEMICLDMLLIFTALYLSKRNITRNTEPIIAAVQTLGNGTPATLVIHGELADIAESVNKVSGILTRQKEARANWISGVSHDIRTPLSMIMGYAERISSDSTTSPSVREQSKIIEEQGIKIKDLIRDLNLVSQLQYDMQPLHRETVRLSRLLRTSAAELLNSGLSDIYNIKIDITADAENATVECDSRLITRAVNNLVQNSIKHNPDGCAITLSLQKSGQSVLLSVSDDGQGFPDAKLREFHSVFHDTDNLDEHLDLKHGLGLYLVKQIITAHKGELKIENMLPHGCRVTLFFP